MQQQIGQESNSKSYQFQTIVLHQMRNKITIKLQNSTKNVQINHSWLTTINTVCYLVKQTFQNKQESNFFVNAWLQTELNILYLPKGRPHCLWYLLMLFDTVLDQQLIAGSDRCILVFNFHQIAFAFLMTMCRYKYDPNRTQCE